MSSEGRSQGEEASLPPLSDLLRLGRISTEAIQNQHTSADEDEEEEEDEDDDLDTDFVPLSESTEDDDDFLDDDEDDYYDAEDNLGNDVEFELTIDGSQGGGDDGRVEYAEIQRDGGRRTRITTSQFIRLLSLSAGHLRHIGAAHGLGGLGDGEIMRLLEPWRNRPPGSDSYPKAPSAAGRALMASGKYGSNPYYVDKLKNRRRGLSSKLFWREIGAGPRGANIRASQSLSQDLIPGSEADKIIHYNHRCYSGQFSDDGNFFFSCSQDFKVRMYDTANPYNWKHYKTVEYPFGQWTITDASLSPDNKFLAYSSIRNVVCLAATDPMSDSEPTMLDFGGEIRPRARRVGIHGNFGIWSVRFSGDGRELVAGTSSQSVIVYDIESRQAVMTLQNHEDDINAVCYGDKMSPHILYSGSDDTTIRVWDRRSMGDGREAGVFIGHTEGITYVDSKGDGRYVLSNGKDQTMKLWDLRKMQNINDLDKFNSNKYVTGFDYRFNSYCKDNYQPHPHDCSVVTFHGHSVLRTLIRCHFSPPDSTNSRYVYTGSNDGKVHIYNLDATLAATINVEKTLFNARKKAKGADDPHIWEACVRDASWHPNAPILAATSWNVWGKSAGTCSIHSWNDGLDDDEGDPPMARNYDSELNAISYDFNTYSDDE